MLKKAALHLVSYLETGKFLRPVLETGPYPVNL